MAPELEILDKGKRWADRCFRWLGSRLAVRRNPIWHVRKKLAKEEIEMVN
jgi:hypothetical protein